MTFQKGLFDHIWKTSVHWGEIYKSFEIVHNPDPLNPTKNTSLIIRKRAVYQIKAFQFR